VLCFVFRPNFQDILTALDAIEAGKPLPLTAAPAAAAAKAAKAAAASAADPAVVYDVELEHVRAPAAAGAIVPPLPPSKPQQQQQVRQQQRPAAEVHAGAAGLFAGVGHGNSSGSSKEEMEWSEVSYGRAAYGRIACFDIE
jgi:hypothetical protein